MYYQYTREEEKYGGWCNDVVTTDHIKPENIRIIQLMDLDRLMELLALKRGARIGDINESGEFRAPNLKELSNI